MTISSVSPNSVEEELKKAEQLMIIEKYNEALDIVKELSKSDNLTIEEKLTCILLESRIIFSKGEIERALKLIEKIWPKISKLENLILILDYLSIKTNYLWFIASGTGFFLTFIGFYFLYTKFGASYYLLYAVISIITTSILVGIIIFNTDFHSIFKRHD